MYTFVLNYKIRNMISNIDFEKLWFLYKTEGAPKGISINSFCVNQGVPYTQFNSWYRKTQKSVVPVVIEGIPSNELQTTQESSAGDTPKPKTASKGSIRVIIQTRDGLYFKKDNLDYQGLKQLVEKLEVLC